MLITSYTKNLLKYFTYKTNTNLKFRKFVISYSHKCYFHMTKTNAFNFLMENSLNNHILVELAITAY